MQKTPGDAGPVTNDRPCALLPLLTGGRGMQHHVEDNVLLDGAVKDVRPRSLGVERNFRARMSLGLPWQERLLEVVDVCGLLLGDDGPRAGIFRFGDFGPHRILGICRIHQHTAIRVDIYCHGVRGLDLRRCTAYSDSVNDVPGQGHTALQPS